MVVTTNEKVVVKSLATLLATPAQNQINDSERDVQTARENDCDHTVNVARCGVEEVACAQDRDNISGEGQLQMKRVENDGVHRVGQLVAQLNGAVCGWVRQAERNTLLRRANPDAQPAGLC